MLLESYFYQWLLPAVSLNVCGSLKLRLRKYLFDIRTVTVIKTKNTEKNMSGDIVKPLVTNPLWLRTTGMLSQTPRSMCVFFCFQIQQAVQEAHPGMGTQTVQLDGDH